MSGYDILIYNAWLQDAWPPDTLMCGYDIITCGDEKICKLLLLWA